MALLLAANAAPAAELGADACAPLIPSALAAKLAQELPGYQVPSSADLSEARDKALNSSGDWPCPLIVLGDFDGNGSVDRALLLKARDSGARLIVVMNNNPWQITLSEDWPLPLADSELRPLQPGLYQRADAINKPTEQFDQLAGLQAEDGGFSAGKLQGPYAVYALINAKWQKLSMQVP